MEQTNFKDFFSLLWRRKVMFLTTALAVYVLVIAFAFLWPPKYRSTGTIQIQQADIPPELLQAPTSNASDVLQVFADQRIEAIQQRITATPNLVDVINKFNLYEGDRKISSIADVIKVMQKAIKLDLLSAELANPNAVQRLSPGQLAAIAFTLSFDYPDPRIAQQVADELISRFLDEDIKLRREQAKATSKFLEDQAADLEKQLTASEKLISDYRTAHAGERPEDLPFNMQMAATTTQTIDSLGQQLLSVERQRGDLEAQMASVEPYSRVVGDNQVLTSPAIELKALQSKYATLSGQYGPNHPDVVRLRAQIDALQSQVTTNKPDSAQINAQINDVTARLTSAREKYGPDYPDVKSLQRQLAELQAKKASLNGSVTDHGMVADADNPTYLMLKYELRSLEETRSNLLSQQAEARKQNELYQKRIAETPASEKEYATLTRDYDNAQLRYRELKEKQMSASMSEQVEQSRQGERLIVIDSPELPTSPHFPPRLIVLAAGLVLAFGSGAVGVQIMQTLTRTIQNSRSLTAIVGVPPLVVIPRIVTLEDRQQTRVWTIRAAAASVVTAGVVLFIIDQFVMPLDVVWSVVTQRLGLS